MEVREQSNRRSEKSDTRYCEDFVPKEVDEVYLEEKYFAHVHMKVHSNREDLIDDFARARDEHANLVRGIQLAQAQLDEGSGTVVVNRPVFHLQIQPMHIPSSTYSHHVPDLDLLCRL